MSQKSYRIDSTRNIIVIDKPRGKKICNSADNYEYQENEVEFKKHLGDTIVIQMKPIDSIIQMRFNELFSNSVTSDTINFKSIDQVDTKLNTYLNYLSALSGKCDNDMCNYSNL